ncbi:glycosyltransferase family 2 protein [Sphingobium xenophagum]|nr:glycosyltransferase family 2 protein [Sphingobium xenophagum]
MMQKNEEDLLGPWIQYHSELFGAENLYVYDNGSTSPIISEILADAQAKGVNVYLEYSQKSDFEGKGDILADKIQQLDKLKSYDFFFPLDCDEFVGVMGDDRKPSFRKQDIFEELEELKGSKRVLFISMGFDNHPEKHGFFRLSTDVKKTFFAANSCKSLDIGYHDGKSVHSNDRRHTRFVYAHYHSKPFEIVQRHTKEKLAGRIENFSEDSLKKYKEARGKGHHLVRFLLYPDAQAYHDSFKTELYTELKSFTKAMKAYGIPLPFQEKNSVEV